MTELSSVKSLSDWPKARKDIQAALMTALGSMPKEVPEPQAKTVDEDSYPGYTRQRVSYFVSDWERVGAWLFVPDEAEEAPAIICCHDKVVQGKDESAGIEGEPLLAFAQHFAERGFVTMAPDCVAMGDRISRGREPFDTKALAKDYPKMTVCGKMAWDYMRAVDVLSDMKGVDPSRIGIIGHGMGGQNALLVSALDERIQACVASAAFTRFADRSDLAAIAETCLFTLVPETGKKTSDAFAFDWEHVLALGAPSPTLLAGAADISVFPGVKSCQQAARLTQNIYKLLGASQALETFEHDSRRCIDLETLEAADDWFARWL